MFWTGLVVALAAVVAFKLGALSVWAQATSLVLTLIVRSRMIGCRMIGDRCSWVAWVERS